MLTYIDLVGFIAGALTTLSGAPQLIRTIRSKKVDSFSPIFLLMLTGGFVVWIAYAFLLGSLPMKISNLIGLGLWLPVLYLRMFKKEKVEEEEVEIPYDLIKEKMDELPELEKHFTPGYTSKGVDFIEFPDYSSDQTTGLINSPAQLNWWFDNQIRTIPEKELSVYISEDLFVEHFASKFQGKILFNSCLWPLKWTRVGGDVWRADLELEMLAEIYADLIGEKNV